MLLEISIATICIALLSLTGVFFVSERGNQMNTHKIILPTAVGIFLGVVFFELIPETIEASHVWGPIAILVGYLGFYILSHILETYHHHHTDADDACQKNGAQKLLIGDAIHNIADGIVIATAFMVDPSLGILTTIGVALHEIPQEIAEFGVLMHAGYTKSRALILNLISASSVVLGAILAYLFSAQLEAGLFILTGIAAGNLLYIATADLIPELRASHRDHFYPSLIATLIGITAIWGFITFTHEYLLEEAHEANSSHTETDH